jgi:hypothetical protein
MVSDSRGIFFQIPFTREEIECRCGCGTIHHDVEFIKLLTAARWAAGIPFPIASWCRCERHNKKVGGVPTSAHLVGKAADILVGSLESRYKILKSLISVGFCRFGIGENFIHVDLDRSKRQGVIWTYPLGKKLK